MVTTPTSESTDGPVLSFINKRIRNLKKKLTRINQIEKSVADGKLLIKEQEDLLLSKPSIAAAIDELEKLRLPLSAAVADEVSLALQHHHDQQASSAAPPPPQDEEKEQNTVVEDLLNLLYFATMFDVKNQSDFTSTMLLRTHERGCCLTYDYVTDDESVDLLSDGDLDLVSMLGGLLVSRPVDSSLSHKDALRRCVSRAKQWLGNSDQPIDSDPSVTYAGLRAKLNKIMASDYFTTTPEMKATVEMAAAAQNYASYQVQVQESMVPVHVEGLDEQYEQKDEDTSDFQGNETYDELSPMEDSQKGELESENSTEIPSQTEVDEPKAESQNQGDVESKEPHYGQRKNYQNQRGGRGSGGGGGRRGYPNGRGARGSSRGGRGPYQNGSNQYYDHPGNYYPRNNYYNNRGGRGGRGGGGGGGNNFYNSHSSGGAQANHAPADS